MKRLKDPSIVSLVAVFAAFTVVCDSLLGPFQNISAVWFSWAFIAEPLNGIILEPYSSFFSTFIGVMVGHSVYFRGSAEFLFTLGAPIGAVVSSLLFRGRWKSPLIYYLVLLGGYFAAPVSWQLPLWGMWNVYFALGLLLLSASILNKWRDFWDRSDRPALLTRVALSTFIGLEADVLFRIFILIPCQTYWTIYTLDVAALQMWWAAGAVETSVKAALSTLVSVMVSIPILKAVQKIRTHPQQD